jgi:hypothetical protein
MRKLLSEAEFIDSDVEETSVEEILCEEKDIDSAIKERESSRDLDFEQWLDTQEVFYPEEK